MNKLAVIALGAGWFSLAYVSTVWLTFPGGAAADYASYQVRTRTNGAYDVRADAVYPWWLGASASKVKIFQQDGDGLSLMGLVDAAAVRVSAWSLLSRQPRGVGRFSVGDGLVDLEVQTVLDDDGQLVVRDVDINGSKLPFELLPLPGVALDGTGALDILLDIQAPDGLQQANGRASLVGRNLVITSAEIPGQGNVLKLLETFAQISEVLVDELQLDFDITEGKASVRRGSLRANVATIDLSGEVNLNDRFLRSVLKLEAAITLDEKLKMVSSVIGAAGADGKHRYEITGTVGSPAFSPARDRGASRLRGLGASTPAPAVDAAGVEARRALPKGTVTTGGDVGPGSAPADAAARSAEIRERLRLRREQRGIAGQPLRPGRRAQQVEINDDEPLNDLYIEPGPEDDGFEDELGDDELFFEE